MSKNKSKGLGDTVGKVTKATGIKKIVNFVAGEDCGCDKRQSKLNKLIPYRSSTECLTENEYNFLVKYFKELKKPSSQLEVVRVYNRVFSDKANIAGCPECMRDIEKELKQVLKAY